MFSKTIAEPSLPSSSRACTAWSQKRRRKSPTVAKASFVKCTCSYKQWISERKYFSADIILEQTSILGKRILGEIATDIRNAYWYSLIADETSDAINQEQFNISVRWVGENFIVHEDPAGVVTVPDTTGDTLFNVIKNVLIRLNLPIRNCRGQAYDGASNMQENIKGVATRVQEMEPSAIHVHCLAHCLNLCLPSSAV